MSYNDHKRKYVVNENFFSSWNLETAYVLGYIAADGFISNNTNSINFGIAARDIDQLKNIQKLMSTNATIKYYLQKPNYLVKSENNIIIKIVITSKKLYEDVKKMGITTKKSLTLPWFDNCPKEFIPHMIRGYFDGDGWISINGESKLRAGMVGNYEFLAGAAENIPVDHPKILINEKEHWSDLRYNGRGAKKFLDFIYKDSTPLTRMQRKYDLYQKSLNIKFRKDMSDYIGVSVANKNTSTWRAYGRINGKYKHIGYYYNEEEAAKAYDNFVIENKLNKKINFPHLTDRIDLADGLEE